MITACTRCQLHIGAKNRVKYRGSPNPIFLFVGIAPGDTEDHCGESFSGPSGKKLFELINKARIPLELCAWSNIVKCVPRQLGRLIVRDPEEDEVDACCFGIEAEIAKVDPAIIIPLGAFVTSYFTESSVKITKIRGARSIVNLPTVRYRYLKMRQSVLNGLFQVDPVDTKYMGVSNKERSRALNNAVKIGYVDTPTKPRTLFPSFHPAAILRGNLDAEPALLADLNYLAQKATETEELGDYKTLTTVEEVVQLCDWFLSRYKAGEFPFLTYDIEATSLDYYDLDQFITLFGVTDQPGRAWLIPYDHHESPFKGDELARRVIRDAFSKLFEVVPIVGHNVKYDLIFSRLRGIRINKIYDDTMLMAGTLFNDQGKKDLESLTSKYTDLVLHKTEYKEVQLGLPEDERHNTDNYDLDLIARYCGGDVDGTHRLYYALEQMLIERDLFEAHKDLPARATIPVAEMEVNGCPLNWELRESLDTSMSAEIAEGFGVLNDFGVIKMTEDLTGKEFKIGSTEQLGTLLFDILSFKPVKYGVTRKNGPHEGSKLPSTDKFVLQELLEHSNEQVQKLKHNPGAVASGDFDMWRFRLNVVKVIQNVKFLTRLHGDYVKSLPDKAVSDGFVRPSYGIRKEDTGRFNCTGPSLQVIPWHSGVKQMFVTRFVNGLIMSADESQMELRIFGMVTGDEQMAKVFREGRDFHAFVASAILNVIESAVQPEERRRIKGVVFGLLYGRGDESVAAQEGISVERAAEIREGIFAKFQGIADFINSTHEFVMRHGYVRYCNGFIRNLPWFKTNKSLSDKAKRQGVNSAIQGPASDLVAQAMINAFNAIMQMRLHTRMWHFVHDSLGFDIPPGELFVMMMMLGKAMNTELARRYKFINAPMRVDYEIGTSWGAFVKASLEDPVKRVVHFSGKEEYFKQILATFDGWSEKPTILSYDTRQDEEHAVIRRFLRAGSDAERIQFTHVESSVMFPPRDKTLRPCYKYRGFTLFGEDEKVLVA